MSAEEHMANYQAARALVGKEKSRAKKGAKKSAVKNHAAMRQTIRRVLIDALSGLQARTLRREAAGFWRVGLGQPTTRFW